MYDDNTCTEIRCTLRPTMAVLLNLSHPSGGIDQEIPYCDGHIGWFYRSFSRESYDSVQVCGIKILLSADEEFGLNRDNK